jgi:membrane protein DedA with SNARE-associated domain
MLFAKFVVGSNVVSLLAGQAGLSAARFFIYDSLGSLTWSGSYIAFGYLVPGQLHWTLAQTLRPLLVVRAAVFLARFWRRRSAYAAMLAGVEMSARISRDGITLARIYDPRA